MKTTKAHAISYLQKRLQLNKNIFWVIIRLRGLDEIWVNHHLSGNYNCSFDSFCWFTAKNIKCRFHWSQIPSYCWYVKLRIWTIFWSSNGCLRSGDQCNRRRTCWLNWRILWFGRRWNFLLQTVWKNAGLCRDSSQPIRKEFRTTSFWRSQIVLIYY